MSSPGDRSRPGSCQRADCIVWFPDDFQAAQAKKSASLVGRNGSTSQTDRTLIYVGRDSTPRPLVLGAHLARRAARTEGPSPPCSLASAQRRNSISVGRDTAFPKSEVLRLVRLDGSAARRLVENSRRRQWLDGVQPAQTHIELREARVSPGSRADVLLRRARTRSSAMPVVRRQPPDPGRQRLVPAQPAAGESPRTSQAGRQPDRRGRHAGKIGRLSRKRRRRAADPQRRPGSGRSHGL